MLIWGSDRAKFDEPETKYRGKQICVTGKISDYKRYAGDSRVGAVAGEGTVKRANSTPL